MKTKLKEKGMFAVFIAAAALVGGSMCSCALVNNSSSWENPASYSESVYGIPSAELTSEQRKLYGRLLALSRHEGFITSVDGVIHVSRDTALIKSYGIEPSYLDIIQEHEARNHDNELDLKLLTEARDSAWTIVYSGGDHFTIINNRNPIFVDSLLSTIKIRQPRAHIYSGSLIHLIDSINNASRWNVNP